MAYELTRDKYLLPEECESLKGVLTRFKLRSARDVVFIETLLATGARSSEILKLTRADLNAGLKSVYVRATKNSRDREIPLPQDLFERLEKISPDVGRIFPFTYNNALRIWHLYRPVKKGLHALRHTAALNFYQRTKDVKLLQTYLGHRSLVNTMIYVDFTASFEDLRRALNGD